MMGSLRIIGAMLLTDTLIVVRSQSDALIRAEVRGMKARADLERACYEAITRLGCTVDEVSEASGLTPAELRRIVADRTVA
jgi:hypothetical protein